jgi:toxin ParE1/3/4
MKLRLTRQADADIVQILRQMKKIFGPRQVLAYAAIIGDGVSAVAADPLRPSSVERDSIRPGLRSFHLELVKGRRRSASHMLYYGLMPDAEGEMQVVLYRVLHEAMEPRRRLMRALRQRAPGAPEPGK